MLAKYLGSAAVLDDRRYGGQVWRIGDTREISEADFERLRANRRRRFEIVEPSAGEGVGAEAPVEAVQAPEPAPGAPGDAEAVPNT